MSTFRSGLETAVLFEARPLLLALRFSAFVFAALACKFLSASGSRDTF